MGWSLGYDDRWGRNIGYGVPAYCDHPDCNKEIDRGLSFVCGTDPYGGDRGCGLYFCPKHLFLLRRGEDYVQLCSRCVRKKPPFTAKPEHPTWINHLLTDESWALWRAENPDRVKKLRALPADRGRES